MSDDELSLPQPSLVERRLIRRDGTPDTVTVPFQDPPKTFIQTVDDNHWYRWSQRLGAYKWYSYRKPRAVQRAEDEVVTLVLIGILVVVLFFVLFIVYLRFFA